jgi:hypothetical protein
VNDEGEEVSAVSREVRKERDALVDKDDDLRSWPSQVTKNGFLTSLEPLIQLAFMLGRNLESDGSKNIAGRACRKGGVRQIERNQVGIVEQHMTDRSERRRRDSDAWGCTNNIESGEGKLDAGEKQDARVS